MREILLRNPLGKRAYEIKIQLRADEPEIYIKVRLLSGTVHGYSFPLQRLLTNWRLKGMGSSEAGENQELQETLRCPACGSVEVITRRERQRFPYGQGKGVVELEVLVPVRRCSACNFEYLDDSSDAIRHDALCKHLGVLTPEDIRRLRDAYGLSRAEFARLTRLGEATLSRWETGVLVQNAANDEYLRLLRYPDNVRRLQARDLPRKAQNHENVIPIASCRFRTLENDERARNEERHFQLRKLAVAR